MKLIKTTESVGHVLCHDITQIIKDVKKGVAFKKGHIIKEEDINVLLSLGKEHLYIWEKKEGMLHENEAAGILCDICKNENMRYTEPSEGKIELIAEVDGVLKVDTKILNDVNSLGEIVIATRHTNFPVKKGDKLAGMRIIPLIIEEEKMLRVKESANNKSILSIMPYLHKNVGIITTGNEVYSGRIKDNFINVIKDKLSEFDVNIVGQEIVDDNCGRITDTIKLFLQKGADLVICTGGMSVDPDDLTPSAIRNIDGKVVTYGAPVLPGAMFMLSYYNENIPVLGLPGCVMYSKRTIFDLVLPRIMAGEILTKEDINNMGHGGLCLSCDVCTYPNCGFGK